MFTPNGKLKSLVLIFSVASGLTLFGNKAETADSSQSFPHLSTVTQGTGLPEIYSNMVSHNSLQGSGNRDGSCSWLMWNKFKCHHGKASWEKSSSASSERVSQLESRPNICKETGCTYKLLS